MSSSVDTPVELPAPAPDVEMNRATEALDDISEPGDERLHRRTAQTPEGISRALQHSIDHPVFGSVIRQEIRLGLADLQANLPPGMDLMGHARNVALGGTRANTNGKIVGGIDSRMSKVFEFLAEQRRNNNELTAPLIPVSTEGRRVQDTFKKHTNRDYDGRPVLDDVGQDMLAADHAEALLIHQKAREESDKVQKGLKALRDSIAEDAALLGGRPLDQQQADNQIQAERERLMRSADPSLETEVGSRDEFDQVKAISKEKLREATEKLTDDEIQTARRKGSIENRTARVNQETTRMNETAELLRRHNEQEAHKRKLETFAAEQKVYLNKQKIPDRYAIIKNAIELQRKAQVEAVKDKIKAEKAADRKFDLRFNLERRRHARSVVIISPEILYQANSEWHHKPRPSNALEKRASKSRALLGKSWGKMKHPGPVKLLKAVVRTGVEAAVQVADKTVKLAKLGPKAWRVNRLEKKYRTSLV